MPATFERLATEVEVAERHCRSIKTLQNERTKGGGIPFLKIGRLVRYRWSDVLAFEEEAMRTSTSDLRGDKVVAISCTSKPDNKQSKKPMHNGGIAVRTERDICALAQANLGEVA